MTKHGVNVALNTSCWLSFSFFIVLKILTDNISACQVVVLFSLLSCRLEQTQNQNRRILARQAWKQPVSSGDEGMRLVEKRTWILLLKLKIWFYKG